MWNLSASTPKKIFFIDYIHETLLSRYQTYSQILFVNNIVTVECLVSDIYHYISIYYCILYYYEKLFFVKKNQSIILYIIIKQS